MAKTESTAVNALIDLVKNDRPISPSEPAADLFGAPPAPLPRSRAPQATREQAIPAIGQDVRVRMTTGPAPRGSTIPPLPRRSAPVGTLPPPNAPVAAPFEKLVERTPELLFDANRDETWVGTKPGARTREDNLALARKLVIPAIACIAAGIGLGFYLSHHKAKSTPTAPATAASLPTAPAPAAPPSETVLHPTPRSLESHNAATSTAGGEQPQPPTKEEQAAQMAAAAADDAAAAAGTLTHDAPATAIAGIQQVQTARGAIKLSDVRIDTDPQGASITLVDGGKQFPLGSTPLSTSLDTSRQYDVIVEMAGRPSQMVHLDPAATSRLDISLGRKQSRAAAPASAPAAAKIEDDLEKPALAPVKKPDKAENKRAAALAEPFETDATPAVVDGPGVLMVSSKPPCEILVDGKATGLTTPQPAMELGAGRHKVTFLNKDAGIKETFTVVVKPGEPTKLIKDFLDRK